MSDHDRLRIVLTALDEPLAAAWGRHCGGRPQVEVHQGSIFDVGCDALVSPANSFGFMDGGIDLLYSRRFGWELQQRLQELIRTHHQGELLVGTAEIVETGDASSPFLIAAPTMRVPMILEESVHPYLAARAVLLLLRDGTFRSGRLAGEPVGEHVRSVAFPGLGTGVGRVDPDVCAVQVAAALDEVQGSAGEFPRNVSEAHARHQLLCGGRQSGGTPLPSGSHPT